MVHNRRPIWVARNPTKPSIRASSGMMARVSATTCAASASERTSIQVTLNAPSRASFPDAMSTLEPKDTGAHLVRLDHDLQAELLDEPSPVEVALDGCDVTVPYPDEVDARKRDRAAGGRSAPEGSRVGAPHDPPSGDRVGIGDRGRRQLEGEIGKGREQRARVGAEGLPAYRGFRRRAAVRAARAEPF